MIKPHLARVLTLCAFACVSLATQAALLQTPENIPLSVPAASVAAGGIAGSTNLSGTNFIISDVVPTTSRGGSASLINSQQWVNRFAVNTVSYESASVAMALRADGGVVVTGYSQGATNGFNFLTLCYAADGTPLWTNFYDGPNHGDDIAHYLATGTNGDVWVVGQSMRYTTNSLLTDVALLCLASNGIPRWINRFTSGSTNQDYPASLAVDGSGNAYLKVTSAYTPPSSNGLPLGEVIDQSLIKYDPLGIPLWTNIFPNSRQPLSDIDVAVDPAGNLFIGGTGPRVIGPPGGPAKELLKFAADGTPQWTNSQSLDFEEIQCDPRGDVIVTGENITNYPVQYVVMKFSSVTGDALWTNTMAGPNYDGGDVPQTLVTPVGDVLLVGGSASATNTGVYQVMKFNSNGAPVWTNLNVNFGTNSELYAATVNNAGELYLVADAPDPTNGSSDYVTMKYSSSGWPVCTNFYDDPEGGEDDPLATAVNGMGEVFVTGGSDDSYGLDESTTVAYADALTYSPPTNFTGIDTIKYTLTDTFGDSAAGSVQVLVTGANFELVPVGFGLSGFQLAVAGAPGTNVVIIQASTDLIHWQPLSTNAPIQGTVQYLDTSAAGFAQRFYRAEQLP